MRSFAQDLREEKLRRLAEVITQQIAAARPVLLPEPYSPRLAPPCPCGVGNGLYAVCMNVACPRAVRITC